MRVLINCEHCEQLHTYPDVIGAFLLRAKDKNNHTITSFIDGEYLLIAPKPNGGFDIYNSNGWKRKELELLALGLFHQAEHQPGEPLPYPDLVTRQGIKKCIKADCDEKHS